MSKDMLTTVFKVQALPFLVSFTSLTIKNPTFITVNISNYHRIFKIDKSCIQKEEAALLIRYWDAMLQSL